MADVTPPLPAGLPQMRAPLQAPQLQLPEHSRLLIVSLTFLLAFLQDAVLFWLQMMISVSDWFPISVNEGHSSHYLLTFAGVYWFFTPPLFNFVAFAFAIAGLVRSKSKGFGIAMIATTVVLGILVPYVIFST